MANFIDYSIGRVLREIPTEIINLAFMVTGWNYQQDRMSIESHIRSEVLDKYVIPDCDIIGGQVTVISLIDATWEYLSMGIRITIPLHMTNGRKINSILSLETTTRGLEPEQATEGTPGSTGTTEVFLVAPNTIFLPINPGARNCHLRCSLENAANLENFSQRAMINFGDLLVLAVKAEIHRRLIINTDVTALTGGSVDGQLRSIIEGYGDSMELYQEMLRTKWRKISVMQDRYQHHRLLKLALGNAG